MLDKIIKRTVTLVGMVGIGCWVLANLASCGVENFIGIDCVRIK